MRWGELYGPGRRAVHQLLRLLADAERAAEGAPGSDAGTLASCFLVYGDRGTGKSTVLLSAHRAITRGDFFLTVPPMPEGEAASDAWGPGGAHASHAASQPRPEDNLTNDTKDAADYLSKRVRWLDVLDVEPLPRRANLLTTLLVRIQHALGEIDRPERSGSADDADRRRISALFDEGADGAREKLEGLLRDASLMWEDILESDTRVRADRQVAAAQTYADFRARFVDAMGTVSAHVYRRTARHAFVLPIDNIDRSTEHLHAIIKLAQLVTCPPLWIVLAGDRVDFDTFLQRAFWNELIRTGEGPVVGGRERAAGEDEALAIARRQASAAGAKVIPIAHRVKVGPVLADEALESAFPALDDRTNARKLKHKLEELSFPKGLPKGAPGSLYDLMHLKLFVDEDTYERWKRVRGDASCSLTFAATHALTLPVRSLNDLHQIIDGQPDTSARSGVVRGDSPAAAVARRMLQHAIDRADLPEWASDRLLRRVIGRDHAQRTTLTLRESGLESADVYFRLATLTCDTGEPPCVARVTLPDQADRRIRMRRTLGANTNGADDHGDEVLLPASVTGWLMILHDILMLDNEPLIYRDSNDPVRLVHCPHVHTWHEVRSPFGAVSFRVRWPEPPLSTFWESELFQALWRVAEAQLESNAASPRGAVNIDELVAAWIEATLALCVGGTDRRERSVSRMPRLGDVLRRAKEARDDPSLVQILAPQRTWRDVTHAEVQRWLLEDLPVLLCPEVRGASALGEGAESFWDDVKALGRVAYMRREVVLEPLRAMLKRLTPSKKQRSAILRAAEVYLNPNSLPKKLRIELDLGELPDTPEPDRPSQRARPATKRR